jgi:hypothetical protein
MGDKTRKLANNILTDGKIDATDGLIGVIPSSNINTSSISSLNTDNINEGYKQVTEIYGNTFKNVTLIKKS